MGEKQRNIGATGLFFILVAILVFLSGCGIGGGGERARELAAVEIRQYEGKDLSSVNDFRENSIKGPQYVDIESYQLNVTGLVEQPKSYKYDEVIDDYPSYKKVVTLDCVEG